MAFSAGYGHPVHGDCVYFKDGLCTLSGVAVDPSGSGCPRFTPKSASKAIQPESALPRAGQPVQVYPTRMGQGSLRGWPAPIPRFLSSLWSSFSSYETYDSCIFV